jgi:hypothetical protein
MLNILENNNQYNKIYSSSLNRTKMIKFHINKISMIINNKIIVIFL